MGVYTAFFAAGLVILQTTLLLLHRNSMQWSFSLVQHSTHNVANSSSDSPWSRCIASHEPIDCVWLHGDEEMTTVLEPFNPHIILLAITCMHSLVCLSGAKRKSELLGTAALSASSSWDAMAYRLLQLIPLKAAIVLLAVLTLIVSVLNGLSHDDLMQYPTIITVVFLFLGGGIYAYFFDTFNEDLDWTLAFHMQLVGIPLTVVITAAMGVRFWIDVLTHTVLLAAAVSCMWIQFAPNLDSSTQLAARFLTVALPTFSLCVTQQEWGTDSWQHVVALMASTSLAPLYILTLYQPPENEKDAIRAKVRRLRVIHLFTSGALLSTIVNLAMI